MIFNIASSDYFVGGNFGYKLGGNCDNDYKNIMHPFSVLVSTVVYVVAVALFGWIRIINALKWVIRHVSGFRVRSFFRCGRVICGYVACEKWLSG